MSKILVHRLHSQQISQQTFKRPDEVVAWLGALQGQDYSGAKWSVGLRLPGSIDADIEQAIADGSIIRTWVMRGTLHLVAAADVRWLVELVGARVVSSNAARYRELELDDATVGRSTDLLAAALQDGAILNRTELFALLEENGISTQGQRGVHLLQRASYAGVMCQGTAPRNNPTFMAMPEAKTMPREEAVAELIKRYFTSRGPATLQDFVGWSGLTITETRAALDALKSQLVQETIDGQTYWMADVTPINPPQSVYALPGFDEYVLGYRERSAFLDKQYANRICPGGNGVFYPTIVSDGRIVGTWKRTLKKNAVVISAEPFEKLSDAEQAGFEAAAARFGAFLEIPVSHLS